LFFFVLSKFLSLFTFLGSLPQYSCDFDIIAPIF